MVAPLTARLAVQADTDTPKTLGIPVCLVNEDGTPFNPGASVAWDAITGKPETYPVAKATVTPLIKAADATAPARTSADAAGETPTKAEFAAVVAQLAELKTIVTALVTEANETKTQANALINSMRAAGLAADK